MFGFAQNLQGLNKDFEGFVNESQMQRNPNGFPRNNNYWSLISDGNWNDSNIWMNGGLKANAIPPLNANILIPRGRIITVNQNITVLNFFNKGTLITDGTGRTITVNGDFISTGATNLSTSNAFHNLVLNGVNNFIQSSLFATGTNSTVVYNANTTKNILPLSYRNLTLNSFIGNYIFNNGMSVSGLLQGNFNGSNAKVVIENISTLNINNITTSNGYIINNSNIYVSNGLDLEFGNAGTMSYTNSNIYLITNNQNFRARNGGALGANIIIDSITATRINDGNDSNHSGFFDGVSASSILDNRGIINYQNATAPMGTGDLQTNNAANTFRYNRAGAQDVKAGTYRTIEFGGSGAKRLLGNVVINVTAGGSQSTTGSATVDLNGFTITTI